MLTTPFHEPQNAVPLEAQATVRNAGLLLVQQGVNVVGGLLFAAVVPRLMGPDIYGRYTLISSLALWFVLASAMGFTPVVGRWVPQFMLQGDRPGLRRFFGNLLVLRAGSGALAAAAYLLLTILWLSDLDPAVLAIMAGVVLIRALGSLFFTLFLGLNQAARWGVGEIVRRWLLLALLPGGFLVGGLRGACLGLLLTEVAGLLVGMWWARPYLARSGLRLDLKRLLPCLRFGLVFFAGDLLTVTFRRSGEALVRAGSGNYVQVGYFGLAYDIYLAAALSLGQLTMAFAPMLVGLLARGQEARLQHWVERLLKWLALAGMIVVLGALLVGDDVAPLVLGSAYRPVAANLVPLSITLLVLAPANVARLLTVVYDRAGVFLAGASMRLATFLAAGLPLVAWQESLGACLAVLVGTAIYGIYVTWRMRQVVRYSLRPWALVIALGALFAPAVLLRTPSAPLNVALYAAVVCGYGSLLLLLRVIRIDEFVTAWQAMRPRASAKA